MDEQQLSRTQQNGLLISVERSARVRHAHIVSGAEHHNQVLPNLLGVSDGAGTLDMVRSTTTRCSPTVLG